MKQRVRVGIDIGNVIIGGGGEDTSFFSDDYLQTPMVRGAMSGVAQIADRYDVWLISKCGLKVQLRTIEWLKRRQFYAFTGVNPAHTVFVKTRPEKADVAKALALHAMIDDRQDIIDSMQGIVPRPILFTAWQNVDL